jgi:hypothetical protein
MAPRTGRSADWAASWPLPFRYNNASSV